MAHKASDIAKGYALMMKSREDKGIPEKCNMSSCGGIDYFRFAHKRITDQDVRIKALQDALREAIEVLDGFGIDGEGLPRLRAILEDS